MQTTGAKLYYLAIFFRDNCMKMEEIGPGHGSLVSLLDPPMVLEKEVVYFLSEAYLNLDLTS